MDHLILNILAIQLQLAQISIERMQTPVAEAAVLEPADYKTYAQHEAIKYGINEREFLGTLECESHWHPDALGDQGHSRGIAQIHDKYHPDVTPAQAFDGVWSIDWAAQKFAQGKADLWSCYRNIYE